MGSPPVDAAVFRVSALFFSSEGRLLKVSCDSSPMATRGPRLASTKLTFYPSMLVAVDLYGSAARTFCPSTNMESTFREEN